MPFADYLKRLVPPWLQQSRWGAYLGALGGELDSASGRTKDGVKARFPGTDYAATDTLEAIAGERQLPRGTPYNAGPPVTPGESDSSLAARLLDAWNRWYWGGTAYGLLRALAVAGYPGAILEIPNRRQYTLVGGNLVITDLPAGSWLCNGFGFWNSFDILFAAPLPTTPTAPSDWGAGPPADNSDEVNALRALVRKWKPAFAKCERIIVITAGATWGYPIGQTWQKTWQANHTGYALNNVVLPTVPNGHAYFASSVSGTGTSGNVEPIWPLGAGATVTDNPGPNQIVWTETLDEWGGDTQTVYLVD